MGGGRRGGEKRGRRLAQWKAASRRSCLRGGSWRLGSRSSHRRSRPGRPGAQGTQGLLAEQW